MLRKIEPIDVDPEAPFKNDLLDRREIADRLTSLLSTIDQPFVLSLTGPWGSGKSIFLKMWLPLLNQHGHPTVYFNAWERDFVEDPLAALLSEVDASLAEAFPEGLEPRLWDRAKSIGGTLLRRGLPLAVRLGTQGFLSLEEVKGALEEMKMEPDAISEAAQSAVAESLEAYEMERDAVELFRDTLERFTASLVEDEARPFRPLVVVVDELDRCRPLFAVELLERVKHLFSARGVVFVLGMDPDQLAHSVRTLYGQQMDALGYLRRFIDLDYRLPPPRRDQYTALLFKRMDLASAVEGRRAAHDQQDLLIKALAECSHYFEFSLRDQEQIFTVINLVLRTAPLNVRIAPVGLGFLVSLRHAERSLYEGYVGGQLSAAELVDRLEAKTGRPDLFQTRVGRFIEAYIQAWSPRPGEFERYQQHLHREDVLRDEAHTNEQRLRALGLVSGREEADPDLLGHVVELIEGTRAFFSVAKSG